MNILTKIINWLKGLNICPVCGKEEQKYCFGTTRRSCSECYGKGHRDGWPANVI